MRILSSPALWSTVAALALSGAVHAADTYNVDPNHTGATFQFKHQGLSLFRGKLTGASGVVTLDTAQRQGRAEITFDANAFATGSHEFDEHLKSNLFFDTAKYPTVKFVSDKFEFKGNEVRSISGNLTVRDITKPVTLKIVFFHCGVNPMSKKESCGANATVTVKRSDFGMSIVPTVSDEIELFIEIEAIKQM